jgi:transposase
MSTPSTPRRKRLTRDQRRDILLLRRRGDSYEQIARFLDVSFATVQYTCTSKKATPQHKKTGRPPALDSDEVDALIEFVKSSRRTRRMTFDQLKQELYSDRPLVGTEAIKYALRKRGYYCRLALRKPLISELNRIRRLEWAHEHLHWSKEQ